nr:hypothetical protein K-LCC10_0142 [Kaumoebavirus]
MATLINYITYQINLLTKVGFTVTDKRPKWLPLNPEDERYIYLRDKYLGRFYVTVYPQTQSYHFITDIDSIEAIFPSGTQVRWENADQISQLFVIAVIKAQLDKI